MAASQNYLAFDLGAESGRAILGHFDGNKFTLSEIHRFPNVPVIMPQKHGSSSLRWDILRLWSDVKEGIARITRKQGETITAIGVDTWGVDFGFIDEKGALISAPYAYRDKRTDGILEKAFERLSREQIFEQTGIQFLQLNSLFQLLAMVLDDAPEFKIAKVFLTMPDIINYWLTGDTVNEFTIATTTQCYDPRKRKWAYPVLEAMGIPTHIFGEIVSAGTYLGKVSKQLSEELNVHASVVAPACHDTGSAAAAVPSTHDDVAWISSGTWSILGTNVENPIINEQSLSQNFTNEGGVGNTYRFCKNITGLWLVQECRRAWALEGKEYSYAELTEMAALAKPLQCFVDPDSPDFLHPGEMPQKIVNYCKRTNQAIPEDRAAIVRCALESIALKYRYVLEKLEQIVGRSLSPLHIVGGGTKNQLLNQFTADATKKEVVCGPSEATALGNIMMQAVALGNISSIQEGREVIRRSCEVSTYQPKDTSAWDEAYQRFLALL